MKEKNKQPSDDFNHSETYVFYETDKKPLRKNATSSFFTVLTKDEASNIKNHEELIFKNRQIKFKLENSAAAGVTEDADNWGIFQLSLKSFWDKGILGENVKIGILDSGLDLSHDSLSHLKINNQLKGFAAFDGLGKKISSDEEIRPTSTHWHGTFCTTIISGKDNYFERGCAPAATIYAAQVLQSGNTGTVASIARGLEWLLNQDCDIISISLGWPGKHEEWAPIIEAFLSRGIVIVAAVGNENGDGTGLNSRSPANYPIGRDNNSPGVLISVGAYDQEFKLADFSGGELVDWADEEIEAPDGSLIPSRFKNNKAIPVPEVVAPGVNIVEPITLKKFREESGSSMATPHITGLLALILSALRKTNPQSTPKAAWKILNRNLIDLSQGIRGGKGRPDIKNILKDISI